MQVFTGGRGYPAGPTNQSLVSRSQEVLRKVGESGHLVDGRSNSFP